MEDKVQIEISGLEEYNQSLKREMGFMRNTHKEKTFSIRWRMFSIYIILAFLLFGFAYINFLNTTYSIRLNSLIDISKVNLNIFIISIAAPGVVLFIYYYLKFTDERDKLRSELDYFENRIQDNQNRINRLLNRDNTNVIPYQDNLSVNDKNIDTSVNQLISNKQAITIDDILSDCRESRDRLIKEVDNLKSRGVINLGIGSALTVVGIGILLFSLLTKNNDGTIKPELKVIDLMNFYLSRITTVIFVEIFSFFFLRLYRNSLSDIKYYQNELTTLEAKFLSLKSALYINQPEVKVYVIHEILKTERNILINSDQTNLINSLLKSENERDRSFTDSFKGVLESLSNFIDKKEKS
ncbi:hypothetical protein [Fibrella forsythiae]|uniref:Uncharacterized protein n=1 Tax=Fibrella forsythiae TaxID=2817061 RepID=A0ABS3JEH9_9BACT|nr:hypothetical protein [Fibrella forsythiae]MBO0947267.1 hypothetical protein [Fibrella forsythiae]